MSTTSQRTTKGWLKPDALRAGMKEEVAWLCHTNNGTTTVTLTNVAIAATEAWRVTVRHDHGEHFNESHRLQYLTLTEARRAFKRQTKGHRP